MIKLMQNFYKKILKLKNKLTRMNLHHLNLDQKFLIYLHIFLIFFFLYKLDKSKFSIKIRT